MWIYQRKLTIRGYKLSSLSNTPQPRQYTHYICYQKIIDPIHMTHFDWNTTFSAKCESKSEQCSHVGASEGVQQRPERVQQCRSVCSNLGACAATSERVQQSRSVCSNVGECAATSERVQEMGACAATSERVQQCRSVCSNVGACAAKKKFRKAYSRGSMVRC